MTTTETDEKPGDDAGTDVTAPADGAVAETVEERPADGPFQRIVWPLLLPLAVVAAVAFFVLNVSRIFIAAAEGNHDLPVIIAVVLTVGVIAGAAAIAAMPQLRTNALVVTVAAIAGATMLFGMITFRPAEGESEEAAGPVEPEGPAVGILEFDSGNLFFELPKGDTVPPGIIQLDMVNVQSGDHTLVFADAAVRARKLAVSGEGDTDSTKVELAAGEYEVYCDIPGHREGGMDVIFNVVEGAPSNVGPDGEKIPADQLEGGQPADPNAETPSEAQDPAANEGVAPSGDGADPTS